MNLGIYKGAVKACVIGLNYEDEDDVWMQRIRIFINDPVGRHSISENGAGRLVHRGKSRLILKKCT